METLNSIWQGLVTGLVLSLMLGTVFFSLIRNSILSGYKSGIYIALGVIICDVMFISLALLSTEFANFLEKYQTLVSTIAGFILMAMGIFMFIKAKPKNTEGIAFDKSKSSPFYFIANGFFLNVINPVNFFSWLTITSVLKFEMHYTLNLQIIFFSASLVSIFLMEFAIAYFASLLKKKITDKVVMRINQVSGLVFFGVGLKLASELYTIWYTLHF